MPHGARELLGNRLKPVERFGGQLVLAVPAGVFQRFSQRPGFVVIVTADKALQAMRRDFQQPRVALLECCVHPMDQFWDIIEHVADVFSQQVHLTIHAFQSGGYIKRRGLDGSRA